MIKAVTGEQIRQERDIFNKAWDMMKRYYNIEQEQDEEWEALVDEAQALYNMPTGSSQPNQLSKDLALAILNHIETVSKDRKGAKGDTDK